MGIESTGGAASLRHETEGFSFEPKEKWKKWGIEESHSCVLTSFEKQVAVLA